MICFVAIIPLVSIVFFAVIVIFVTALVVIVTRTIASHGGDCILPAVQLAAMPTYKLSYFGITGLGEHIRIAFVLAGIPFEDDRLTGDAWKEKKADPKFANCQLPILEITADDGSTQMMTQSRAILRYIGRIGTFEGKKLYPDDPMEQYHCDEIIETVEDFRPKLIPTFAIADQAEKEAARAALVAPGGGMYQHLEKLDVRLGNFSCCRRSAFDRRRIRRHHLLYVSAANILGRFSRGYFQAFPQHRCFEGEVHGIKTAC
jgi:glutathione S-transferase